MDVNALEPAALEPWIEVRFDPASGPGGQHVNKVATRATLLFDFEQCDRLSDTQRGRIRARLSGRLSRDGRLRVVRQSERSQRANREAAAKALVELLQQTLRRRPPRRPTRPTAGSRERRLKRKKQRGEKKRLRQRRPAEEG